MEFGVLFLSSCGSFIPCVVQGSPTCLLRVCGPQDCHVHLNVWGVIFQEEDQLLRASPPKVKTPLLLHLPHFMKGPVAQRGVEPPPISIRGAGPAVGGSERIIPAPDARPHAGSLRGAQNPPAPCRFLRATGTVPGPRAVRCGAPGVCRRRPVGTSGLSPCHFSLAPAVSPLPLGPPSLSSEAAQARAGVPETCL